MVGVTQLLSKPGKLLWGGKTVLTAGYCTLGSGSALACWTVDLSLPSPAFPDGAHGEDVFCQPPLCVLYKAQQLEGAKCGGQPGGAAAGEEKQCPLQVLLPCFSGEGRPHRKAVEIAGS